MIDFEPIYLTILGLLVLSIVFCIIRVFMGPTAPDRVVGLDTVNTLVISGMIVYAFATGTLIYIDVAIVYALLSYISTLFIAKYLEGGEI
jgi:multicomponent Na+:H+ antiporter subunit F